MAYIGFEAIVVYQARKQGSNNKGQCNSRIFNTQIT